MQRVENHCRIRDTADMEYSLEQMARSLVRERLDFIFKPRPTNFSEFRANQMDASCPRW